MAARVASFPKLPLPKFPNKVTRFRVAGRLIGGVPVGCWAFRIHQSVLDSARARQKGSWNGTHARRLGGGPDAASGSVASRRGMVVSISRCSGRSAGQGSNKEILDGQPRTEERDVPVH